MTDILEKPDLDTDLGSLTELIPYDDTEDGDSHHTHIVNPQGNTHIWHEGMPMQTVVDIARLNGLPVKALCGYTWVPKRNPEKYPACQKCFDIAGIIMQEDG